METASPCVAAYLLRMRRLRAASKAEQIGLIGLCIQFLEIGRAGGKPVESLNTSKMGGVSRADDVFWGCKYSG